MSTTPAAESVAAVRKKSRRLTMLPVIELQMLSLIAKDQLRGGIRVR
jgi:hypothetical protein